MTLATSLTSDLLEKKQHAVTFRVGPTLHCAPANTFERRGKLRFRVAARWRAPFVEPLADVDVLEAYELSEDILLGIAIQDRGECIEGHVQAERQVMTDRQRHDEVRTKAFVRTAAKHPESLGRRGMTQIQPRGEHRHTLLTGDRTGAVDGE